MQKSWHKLFEIIDEFMTRTNLQWNHADWLDLLSRVERAGFIIDEKELGRMVEKEREKRRH